MLILKKDLVRLKITPAHDFNDFEVGQKTQLRNY